MFVKQASIVGTILALSGANPAIATDYLVKFKDAARFDAARSQKTLSDLRVLDTHATGLIAKISVDDTSDQGLRSLATVMQRDDIEYVVENFSLKMLGTPNDPSYSRQWALPKIEAPRAWERGVGSRSVIVAVIDTGIDWQHPDLADNIWSNKNEIANNGIDDYGNGLIDDIRGWDFLDNDANPNDETSMQNPGHGTHCAGIVGALGDNEVGISGINHQVSIMPLRFIGPSGEGDLLGAIKAIDYAIEKNVDVISASWGASVTTAQARPLIEAVERASAAGLTFVAAASNDGANNDREDMYPDNANAPNLISVAASNANDKRPSWSNYGKSKVHLAAPGQDIYSTLPRGKYANLSGTSMATPLVAGLVALIKSQTNEPISGAQVRALLQSTGSKVAIETACMCRIDAAAALEAIANNTLVIVPAAATLAPSTELQLEGFGGSGKGYHFRSADPAIVEVTDTGSLAAKAAGETTVTITDSAGQETSSLLYRVIADNPRRPASECPFGRESVCNFVCAIIPVFGWCGN